MQLIHPNGETVAFVAHNYIVVDGLTLINSSNSRSVASQMAARADTYQVYQYTGNSDGYTGWVEIPIVRRNRHYVAHV